MDRFLKSYSDDGVNIEKNAFGKKLESCFQPQERTRIITGSSYLPHELALRSR